MSNAKVRCRRRRRTWLQRLKQADELRRTDLVLRGVVGRYAPPPEISYVFDPSVQLVPDYFEAPEWMRRDAIEDDDEHS